MPSCTSKIDVNIDNMDITHQNIVGKKSATIIVGTTASDHTESEVDYLCDGTDDQTVINNAISALPSTGGRIVIREGTYNLSGSVNFNKSGTLEGVGISTILKRMYDGSSDPDGLITINSTNSEDIMTIQNLCVDGNKNIYSYTGNTGILINQGNNHKVLSCTCINNYYGIYYYYLGNGYNAIVANNSCRNNYYGIYSRHMNLATFNANICSYNQYGIYVIGEQNSIVGSVCHQNSVDNIVLEYGLYNTISGNTTYGGTCGINIGYGCYNNTVSGNIGFGSQYNFYVSGTANAVTGNTSINGENGIYLGGTSQNTISGNACYNNNKGILLQYSSNNTISGNTAQRGSGTPGDYSVSQYTIYLDGTGNHYNLVTSNNIMGKDYVSSGGTGNTFVNNKYN